MPRHRKAKISFSIFRAARYRPIFYFHVRAKLKNSITIFPFFFCQDNYWNIRLLRYIFMYGYNNLTWTITSCHRWRIFYLHFFKFSLVIAVWTLRLLIGHSPSVLPKNMQVMPKLIWRAVIISRSDINGFISMTIPLP